MSVAVAPGGVLAVPGFARLWVAGGVSSAMMWLEVLAAALFTLAVTGSPFAVAVVSAARAAPLLLVGAFVGVAADAWDRKRIVLCGLLLTAASSGAIAALALSGLLRPWHLGVAALVAGLVYASELPARRRLIADVAGPERLERAVALDSLTSFATRALGPLLGGAGVAIVGIGGAYLFSALGSLLAAALVLGVTGRQEPRSLSLASARQDLIEGLRFARGSKVVSRLLWITTVMNFLGWSYTSLIAPVGAQAGLSDAAIGALAAAEPAGGLCGALLLATLTVPGRALAWLAGGSAALFAAMVAALVAPPLWPLCAALAVGGVGVAAYSNMQVTIVMREVPPKLRSRVFGLVSMCVGAWPIGQLMAGGLAEFLTARQAMAALGAGGLALLAILARRA